MPELHAHAARCPVRCRAVEVVCREGPARVMELAQMGAEFTTNNDGSFHLTKVPAWLVQPVWLELLVLPAKTPPRLHLKPHLLPP